jgi:hypothetical protein
VFKILNHGFWLAIGAVGGNSGGPVFDSEGLVVGIGVAMNHKGEELGMYVQKAKYAKLDPIKRKPKKVAAKEDPIVKPPPKAVEKPPEAVKPPPPAPTVKPDAGPLLQPRSLQERTERTTEDL